ncbi:beta-ketoacyl synthase chain length factor [Flavobacteriales bacterium]|nr:beta-ketoacyl synthase chain length factor [Flavobacteriales bacterium]
MYIKDLKCISPQNTFDDVFFGSEPIVYNSTQLNAVEPSYSDIPRGQLRRMGKSNRMATGVGMPLLQKWKTDGIIIGTSDGGMEDCHKFLNQIIAYEEGTLTPTGFVQGSPSSPAGGLALMSHNSGYNNTHSNEGLSFENCLVDASLLFGEGRAKSLLIGCVEENSSAPFRIAQLAEHVRSEDVSSDQLIGSESVGSIQGEGAVMFVVDVEKQNALAEIVDQDMISHGSEKEVQAKAENLLKRNGIHPSDIDCLLLGFSGDVRTDSRYTEFASELFPDAGQLSYKNMFGENASASGFATWMAVNVLNGKTSPELAIQKRLKIQPKTILIYNQHHGNQHGFVLMKAV